MSLKTISRIPRFFIRKFGYDVVRYVETPGSANFRRLNAIQTNQVDLVLDVGASEGFFGTKLRKSGYKGRIISFEPLDTSYKNLLKATESDEFWKPVNTAIGNYDGEVMINISGRETSSSILPMLSSHTDVAPDSFYVDNKKVFIKRLDSLLNNVIAQGNHLYLKIDVQGYERNVLEGAVETLKRTEVIEVEVSMVPLYEGSILFREMLNTLDNLGFILISWDDVLVDPKTGFVLQSDCIFMRKSIQS